MTRPGEVRGVGCSIDTQRIMAESEMPFDEVSGDTDSSELDCSLDLFFEEEEEGPAIPEGPSDNNLPVRAYRYEPYLDADAIPPTPASPPGAGDEAVTVSDRLQNTDW